MTLLKMRRFILACGLLAVAGCSKDAAVSGKWSRGDDAVVIELKSDKTGTITADNVKIYRSKGLQFPGNVQLTQQVKCKWSLSEGNVLKIEEVGADSNVLNLKLEGNSLTREGKIIFTKK